MAVFNVGSGVRGKKKKKAVATEQYPEPIGPVQKKEEERKPLPPSPPGTVTRDAETGEVSGFINSEGDFVKAGRKDVEVILARQQEKLAPMPGEVTTEQFAGAQQNQELLRRAQQGLLTQEELQQIQGANVDIGQALGAGGVGVLPGAVGGLATGIGASVVGGAIAGGAAGSIVPVAGTITLGALGAVAGFLVAVRSNLKS